jgi:ABC-2 type transport system permease protein
VTAPRVGRGGIVAAIIAKDVAAFLRDRFWVFMTLLALVWFVGLYAFMPETVDESLRVGVHWTDSDAAFDAAFGAALGAADGLEVVRYPSREALEEALGMGATQPPERLTLGLGFPDDFLVRVHLTLPTSVRLYVDPEVPDDVRPALAAMVRESAYALTGHGLPVRLPDAETVVLGEDRLGRHVPLRDKLRPLYAFMMLVVETYALGALIAAEVSSRTVRAVLATPARMGDFLAAKTVTGTLLAFTEASLLMVLVRGFGHEPLLVAAALLLGAVLVTGVALTVGGDGRNFIGTIFASLVFLIPLAIPALAVLFPGTTSPWVQVLPTHGLVQIIVGATTGPMAAREAAPHLASLAAWCALALALGLLTLRRRVALL